MPLSKEMQPRQIPITRNKKNENITVETNVIKPRPVIDSVRVLGWWATNRTGGSTVKLH